MDNCNGVYSDKKYGSILHCCRKPFKGGEKLMAEQMSD